MHVGTRFIASVALIYGLKRHDIGQISLCIALYSIIFGLDCCECFVYKYTHALTVQ